MIGQKYLKQYVSTLLKEQNFPRFSIFVGQVGSGRKTFLSEYFPNAVYLEDNKVSSVRALIEMAYKHRNKVFIMPDADTMSNAAKNALLKIVEECPNDNYFIMTLEDDVNTLETIKSRAQIFYMDSYFPKQIAEYATGILKITDQKAVDIIADVCETPGEVNKFLTFGIIEFYDYVKLVYDNLDTVSLANALKIPSKLALKEGAEGYDLKLFWRIFQRVCITDADRDKIDWVIDTSSALIALKSKGINRQMLVDKWLLDIRLKKEGAV